MLDSTSKDYKYYLVEHDTVVFGSNNPHIPPSFYHGEGTSEQIMTLETSKNYKL